jgi:hypothetical protein
MADRLNDTDPQSPRALGSKTDPGLGTEPVVLPPRATPRVAQLATSSTPPPAEDSAAIEELLDGITGPRPPASSRARPHREGSDGDRAYAAARPAPPSRSMPPPEPLVVSPEPPHYEVVGHEPPEDDAMRRRPDPSSTRPVVRRAAEERTVLTGRRALIRNIGVAVASSVVVALSMMTIMRWRETHRPRRASAVVVLPAVPDPEAPTPSAAATPSPPSAVTGAAALTAIATAVPSSAPTPMPPQPPSAASARATSGGKRGKGEAKVPSPAASSLDDLNREIRH